MFFILFFHFLGWYVVQVFSTVDDQGDEESESSLGDVVGITTLQDFFLVVFQTEIQLWSARQVIALLLTFVVLVPTLRALSVTSLIAPSILRSLQHNTDPENISLHCLWKCNSRSRWTVHICVSACVLSASCIALEGTLRRCRHGTITRFRKTLTGTVFCYFVVHEVLVRVPSPSTFGHLADS